MKEYKEKLKMYAREHSLSMQHLHFEASCHSVEEAARAVNGTPEEFVKSICMIRKDGALVVAIVRGVDRASTTRVGKALNEEPPRIAKPEEMLELTGYPCGGTPAFGYDAVFLIDEKVMEQPSVYSGGGTEQALIKSTPQEVLKANNGRVVRVRK